MATDRTENHRPLRGGIAVWPSTGLGARGTLTAVARRVGFDTKVLVTNIHVVSTSADNYTLTEGEYLYQGGTAQSDRIGKTFTYTDGANSWLPVVSSGEHQNTEEYLNPGDITLLDVQNGVTTDFGLHVDDGSGGHEQRPIVFPPVDPLRNMKVQVFGSVTGPGEARITVADGPNEARRITVVNSETEEKLYYRFKETVVLSRVPHPGQKGDSGAPCVWEDDDGNYRLVCILYGGIATINLETEEPERLTGYAMPARLAESLLGIYFGVKAPTAEAGDPITANVGETITLDGGNSMVNEPDAGPLEYSWERYIATPRPTDPLVGPQIFSTSPTKDIVVPPVPGEAYLYQLTVKDANGAKHSDLVRVIVNTPPVAKPGPNRVVPVHTPPSLTPAVTLLGAAEDSDAGHVGDMRYSWRVDSAPGSSTRSATTGPTVALSDANVARPTFTPTAIGDYVFTLTVRDPGDLTHSANVTIHACSATGESRWYDTRETRCHNNARQKHQTQVKDGMTEFQWVADPDNEEWGAWQDTSASHRNEEPGDWRDSGRPTYALGNTWQTQERTVTFDKQQTRTSHCNNMQTQWNPATKTERRRVFGSGWPISRPPTPTGSQWTVRHLDNKLQVKVTSLPTVTSSIIEVRARLEGGSTSDRAKVIKPIGTTLNTWVTVLSSSDDRWREGAWVAKIRFENSEKNSNYSATKPVTVPRPPVRWVDTNPLQIRGCGPTREKQQVNANNTSETRWVAAPEDLVWSELENDGEATEVTTAWEDQGSPSLFGGVCKQLQRRTATTTQNKRERNQCGGYRPAEPVVIERTDYQRVTIAETWGNWRDTGNTREHPVELIIEKEQERFSSPCNRRETRWVACAWEDVSPPETRNRVTGNWMDTGNQRENQVLLIIEKEQTRTVTWEKKQQCTGGGTDLYRWVPTSRTETRWRIIPEVCGSWRDVSGTTRVKTYGTYRNVVPAVYTGFGASRRRKQTRTNTREKQQSCTTNAPYYNTRYRWIATTSTTETRWVSDPEEEWPTTWTDTGSIENFDAGTWRDLSTTQDCGPDRERKQSRIATWRKEQFQTSNLGNRRTRWVSASRISFQWRDYPEPLRWTEWTDTGRTREHPVELIVEKEQQRTSHCGGTETQWVVA